MTNTVRYGIIGCGMMGQEHIRNISLLPRAEIAAVFDPDPVMLTEAESLVPGVAVAESLVELIEHPALDTVLIASPNHLHLDQLEAVISMKPIPVMVEKPLFTAPEQLARAQAVSKRAAAPVWVAMEYRYMPAIAEFLERMNAATGGVKMLTIREHRFPFLPKVGNWNRLSCLTGGTLVEKCCHFFDLMRHAIGDQPVRVMASAGQDVNHLTETVGASPSDILDNAFVIVDFANGVRAMLDLCMFSEGSRFQEEITAVGPEGRIDVFIPGPTRFWPDHLGSPPVSKIVISPRSRKGQEEYDIPVDPVLLRSGDHNGATYFQHCLFLETVLSGREPEVTMTDGIEAVRIGHAAQLSAEQHKAVKI